MCGRLEKINEKHFYCYWCSVSTNVQYGEMKDYYSVYKFYVDVFRK